MTPCPAQPLSRSSTPPAGVARALFAALWWAPLAAVAAYVRGAGVNVPFDDDFAVAAFLNGARGHGLRWADLVAQHNESRLVTLRLLCWAAARAGGTFDVRVPMAASVVTVAVTGWMVRRLARRSFGPGAAGWAVAIVANGLLCWPSQWQNFTWGVQWIVFVPAAAVAVGLVALGDGVPAGLPVALGTAVVAAAVATYTNSNGFLVWAVLLPAVWRHGGAARWRAMAAWAAAAGVGVGYYFHDYVPPAGHASYRAAVADPAAAGRFLLAFLGNGLRWTDRPASAAVVGAVAVGLCSTAGLLCGGDRDRRRRAFPWVTLAGYAVASGAVATAGRVGLGPAWAVPPRYPTFALPLYVATVALWALAGERLRRRHPRRFAAVPAGVIVVLLVVLLIVAAVRTSRFVRGESRHYHASRLTALALVQWLDVATDDAAVARTLYPQPTAAVDVLRDLGRNGLLPPPRFRPGDVPAIASPGSAGRVERVAVVGDDVRLAGWAVLPGRGTAADVVLFTVADSAGTDHVIALTGDVHRTDGTRACGWAGTVPRSRLPAGAAVSAWAYDALARRTYRLAADPPGP